MALLAFVALIFFIVRKGIDEHNERIEQAVAKTPGYVRMFPSKERNEAPLYILGTILFVLCLFALTLQVTS